MDTLTLVDEEGQEHEFQLLNMLEIKDKRYAVLIPLDEEDNDKEEGTAVVLRVEEDENGEEYLTDIADDEEFNMVVEALEALDAAE
ncbi:MAG: DUF1292 domain-containing protein [Firmicutes bacterium]|nr:DUF1292 domain-containing protein [Bacillota bacterium]